MTSPSTSPPAPELSNFRMGVLFLLLALLIALGLIAWPDVIQFPDVGLTLVAILLAVLVVRVGLAPPRWLADEPAPLTEQRKAEIRAEIRARVETGEARRGAQATASAWGRKDDGTPIIVQAPERQRDAEDAPFWEPRSG